MLIQWALPCLLSVCSFVQATPARTISKPDHPETLFSPDEDTCSDFKTCSSKGYRYWRELQAKLAQAHPVDVTSGKIIFDRDYGCEWMSTEASPGLDHIRPDLEQHGFEWEWTEAFGAFSKNPETGKDTEATAYSNMFYTSKGLVLATENFRRLDEQKTLPFSEIVYYAWQVAWEYDNNIKGWRGHPGGGPISTLQSMVQIQVQNPESSAVIRTIWDDEGWEWNILDPTWHKFTVADSPLKFWALLGTVNVKATVFLLKDHAAEVGKKTIIAIWVRWPHPDPDIWIDIGSHTAT